MTKKNNENDIILAAKQKSKFFEEYYANLQTIQGEYYLFTPNETVCLPGEENGKIFNRHFDITDTGNFEGKNIPNLLKSDPSDKSFEPFLMTLDEYRKKRYSLHRDEKVLTAWNGLMIAAMCRLYIVNKNKKYLCAAKKAECFIRQYLSDEDTLYVSYHLGKQGVRGFLDDYAAFIFAQPALCACVLCDKVLSDFADEEGGFYLYSAGHNVTKIIYGWENYNILTGVGMLNKRTKKNQIKIPI